MSVAVFVWAEAVKVPGEKHVGWDVDVGNGLNVGVSIITIGGVVGSSSILLWYFREGANIISSSSQISCNW